MTDCAAFMLQYKSLELCSKRTRTLCSRGLDGVDDSRLVPLHGCTDKLFGHLGAQADEDELTCYRRRYLPSSYDLHTTGRPCLGQAALG